MERCEGIIAETGPKAGQRCKRLGKEMPDGKWLCYSHDPRNHEKLVRTMKKAAKTRALRGHNRGGRPVGSNTHPHGPAKPFAWPDDSKVQAPPRRIVVDFETALSVLVEQMVRKSLREILDKGPQ